MRRLLATVGLRGCVVIVRAFEFKAHIASDRNVDFVSGEERGTGCGLKIRDLPPPLKASHPDRKDIRGRKTYRTCC